MDNQKLSERLSAPPDCAECNGKGYAELIDGWERPCDACRGEGFVMDKAEQPTITQADELLREIFLHGHSEGWTGNQTRRDVQHVDAEKGWSLYVSNGALEKTKARHRTTSLAAQDDWTTKRVAELVAEGDGHWRSCTGCHETNEGAETGDYPFNPVFKTYQGGGCGECGGIGVVWDDIDYADYAEFCLNADDDAPSLAAQEVDSGMSGDAVERAEWFWTNLPTGRKWTGLATHEKALVCHQIARITPSPAAQDGLVEAEIDRRVAEERAKLLEQLRGLSLWLGAGSGSDDAAELEKRIRWGVDHQVSSTVQRCADVVERLSKKPGTRWGEVKAAILELQEVQFEKENSHEQG